MSSPHCAMAWRTPTAYRPPSRGYPEPTDSRLGLRTRVSIATDTTNMELWNTHNPFRACLLCADGYMVVWDYKNAPFLAEYNPLVRESRSGADMFYFARGDRIGPAVDAFAAEVADLAFALLLSAARLTCEGDRYVRAGRWHDGALRFGIRVNRKRLGIVGLGRIGRMVAKRAGGFAMEVHYHEPSEMTNARYRYHGDLIELARAVDFLVVACTSGPETDGLINGRVLKALGSGGVLVNMARRAVNEAALIEALKNGVIAGAALDTFAHEPRVPDALTAMENVVLQAHMGTKTWESKRAFAARTAANLDAYFAGAPLPNPVP